MVPSSIAAFSWSAVRAAAAPSPGKSAPARLFLAAHAPRGCRVLQFHEVLR
jgi:hypothetical protein